MTTSKSYEKQGVPSRITPSVRSTRQSALSGTQYLAVEKFAVAALIVLLAAVLLVGAGAGQDELGAASTTSVKWVSNSSAVGGYLSGDTTGENSFSGNGNGKATISGNTITITLNGNNKVVTAIPKEDYVLESFHMYDEVDKKEIQPTSKVFDLINKHTYRLTATFNGGLSKYTITNSSSPAGYGSTSVNKTSAASGEGVKATAYPNTGYHFVNWTCVNLTSGEVFENPYEFSMPAKNVSLTANFVPNTTDITLMVNGGEGADTSTVATYGSSDLTSFTPASRTGYTLAGYRTAAESGFNVISAAGILLPGDGQYTDSNGVWKYTGSSLNLYANWTAVPATCHIVTFNPLNGTAAWCVPVEDGQKVSKPSDPSKTGYTFKSWNKDSVSGEAFDFNTVITADTSLFANYTANSYTVKFHSNNGSDVTKDQAFVYDIDQNLDINTFVYAGHTFNHWTTASDGSGTVYNDGQNVINLTSVNGGVYDLYANWTEIPPTVYSVTNSSSDLTKGRTAVNKSSAIAGEGVKAAAYAVPGYHFVKWACINLTSEVFENPYEFTMPAKDVSLTASFAANSTLLILTDADGNTFATRLETYGVQNTSDINPHPTKAGFTFNGWHVRDSAVQLIDDKGKLIHNVKGYTANDFTWINTSLAHNAELILDPDWEPIGYLVTYHGNGNTSGTVPVDFNSPYKKATKDVIILGNTGNLEKTGYHFTGWNMNSQEGVLKQPNDRFDVSASTDFYANWTINNYTVTFYNETDVVYTAESVDHGSTVSKPADPVKAGHAFTSWRTESSSGPEYDFNTEVTAPFSLYANWSVKNYWVNFSMMGHGTQVDNQSVAYNTYASEPSPAPTADSYTFNGWYSDPVLTTPYVFETTPVTEDIELYANWTAVKYLVTASSSDPVKGSASPDKSEASIDEQVTAAATPNPGYRFVNWTSDPSLSPAEITENPYTFTMPGEPVSLTANFAGNVTTLNLTGADGAKFAERLETFNETNSEQVSPLPEKPGYTFAGWNISGIPDVQLIDEDGCLKTGVDGYTDEGGKWINSSIAHGTELILTAEFTPNITTVSYYNETSGLANISAYTIDSPFVIPEYTKNASIVVNGWNLSSAEGFFFADASFVIINETYVTDGNWCYTGTESELSVYMNWSPAPKVMRNVTFHPLNGYDDDVTVSVEDGTCAADPGEPTPRWGYEFNYWSLGSPSGPEFDFNTVITQDTDLYASWTAIHYLVSFDKNGGEGTMPAQDFVYDAAPKALSANTFSKSDFSFAGWSTSSAGAVIYSDEESVQNINTGLDPEAVTLYAVWTKNLYGINVTLENVGDSAAVKIMRGNKTVSEASGVVTSHLFTGISPGVYDVVAVNASGKTVTSIAELIGRNVDVTLTFPAADVNSVVAVSDKENTPAVVVGNLDKEAEDNAVAGKKVTITLSVEAKTGTDADPAVREEIETIVTNVSNGIYVDQFLEITVTKTEDSGVPERLGQTTEVIELLIPYDFTGKKDVKVYRVHNGVYSELTQVNSRTNPQDGTYMLDREHGLIYVFTKQFSMYSVGYSVSTPSPQPQHHNSRNYGVSIWLTATPTPVPGTDIPGTNVTPTPTASLVKQAQASSSPVPFAGILAGLGAAAAVAVLRRK